MKKVMYVIALLTNVLFIPALTLAGDTLSTEVNTVFTISLKTQHTPSYPVLGITILCLFKNLSSADTVSIPAFWNGDSTYLVRYSFPETGMWSYSISSDDTSETSLNTRCGFIHVLTTTRTDNPFYTKGRPVVSSNGRYLTYKNGDPFFYLACTCWEITWKSTMDQVRRYVSDRKKKGFTAFQLNIVSHQFLDPWGVINRHGDSAFIGKDFYCPNPRYMMYLDSIIQTMNDSGMVAVITPLFAGLSELNWVAGNGPTYMTKSQTLLWYKYVGSRYAGSNVMWIDAGDNKYDSINGRNAFWSAAAETLKTASGGKHLMSIHPSGWQASFQYYNNSTDWLDFNMYQSSHVADSNNTTWQYSRQGWNLKPTKPVFNAECCYEDIYNNLWEQSDTSCSTIDTFRIRAEQVRKAVYESVLSGGIVGIAYGGNGIWQWSTPENPGTHHAQYFLDSAWKMPGSTHMGVARRILEKYKWYEFSPDTTLILNNTPYLIIPVSVSSQYIMLYIPKTADSAIINPGKYVLDSTLTYIDPMSGLEYSKPINYDTNKHCIVYKPNTNDWIVVGTITAINNSIHNNPTKDVTTYRNAITSRIFTLSQKVSVRLQCAQEDIVHINLYSVNGQRVLQKSYKVSSGLTTCMLLLSKSYACSQLIMNITSRNGTRLLSVSH